MFYLAVIQKMQEITVDTVLQGVTDLRKYHFYQGDVNGVKFLLNITHEGAEKDLSTATKVQIAFLKPDGTRVFQDCSNVNQTKGKYYVVLNTQSITAVGNVVAQIRITFPDSVIETTKFVFWVSESVMSEGALQSTNDFPAIQQLIEAGKKFEGKDINAIIAAGAKADAALPKTGGTMTGHLNFQGNQNLQWFSSDGTTRLFSQFGTPTTWGMTDVKGNQNIFTYDATTKVLNINSGTNLARRTGDTFTGNIGFDVSNGGKLIRGENAGAVRSGFLFEDDGFRGYDWQNNRDVFRYISSTNTFNLNASNTNLTYKTGDTFTGHMNFRGNINHELLTNTNKGVSMVVNDSASKWAIAPKVTGAVDWNKEMALDLNTGKLTVADFATKKDGRVNLTLTTDGSNPDVNYPLTATRRGNTVTVSGSVMLNSATTGATISNLPVDMRPVGNVNMYTPVKSTTSGDVMQVFINATSGALALYGIRGKTVDFVLTYTAN
ncbi:phage baseplate upper protein [Bacillus toyonensis]|nr:phage baseplate upper protein [Bacillus toyonensis]